MLGRSLHPPTGKATRPVAAALALLLSGAPVLEVFHAATVPHVTCSEDGQLIDAPALPEDARPVAHHSTDEGSTLVAQRAPVPASTGDLNHDHCAVAFQGKLRARADSKSFSPFAPRASELSPSVAPEPPELGSLAVYLLAPKASPPLA